MDHQGNDQTVGLSVNAAVFVPRNYAPPLGTGPVQNIPTYMTNCFPFVQPDFNGNRFGGHHGNWNRQYRPNRLNNRNGSGYSGNRFPAPNKFSEPPIFPFSSPPPTDPYINNFIVPPNNMFMNNMASLPVMPSGFNGRNKEQTDQGLENDNNNSFTSNNRRRRNQRDGNVYRSNESIGTEEGGIRTDNYKRQRRRTNSGRKGGNKRETTKTLVLYEREVQTDFSDNFANLNLEEYPSPLYKPNKRKYRINENRDLDSGYSSPLHRGNQVSTGTQSEPKLPWVMNSNSVQSDDPSIVSAATAPQQKFSYAFIARKEPSPQPVINLDNPKSAHQEVLKDRWQKSNDRRNVSSGQSNKFSNKSQDFQGRKPMIHNESNNENRTNNRNYPTSDIHPELQSKGNLGKITGQKRFTDKDENQRGGYSAKYNVLKEDSSDYGFSRTKNRNFCSHGDRKHVQGVKNEPESSMSYKGVKMENKIRSQSNENSNNELEEETDAQGKKKRRRRRRRRKKKNKGGDDSQDEEECLPKHEIELHFEDVEEFPDLSSAKASENLSPSIGLSYSAILQATPIDRVAPTHRVNKTSSSEESPRKDNANEEAKGCRASRRRKKRKDLINKAAENELAEIGLEQQMLKEQCLKTTGQKGSNKDDKGHTPGILKINPKAQPAGKKSKQIVSLDLGAVIDALEQKKTTISLTTGPKKEQKPDPSKKKDQQKSKIGHNVLDANAPTKRGKERETPKPKKPSPLKKVILKEREEKKHLRMLEGSETATSEAPVGIGVVSAESDLSQDAMSTKSSVDYTGTPGSANLSPVSQTSPISMSPLSPGTSPLSSEVNSPIAGAVGKDVVRKIHSRRFREYCNQVLDKDIDECATTLLQDLVRFQDRMYHKDPSKAKLKRRLVLGLREVTKHLKLKKIKCVIISPNLEKIQSKGGLDEALNNILNLCNEQNVPFVFALGRKALGRACAKLVPVSVVGIFNYSGSEENFHQLIDLTEKARESYGEMVSAIEKEIKEYPTKMQQPTMPHVFAHMGHSRTPSGASVLSFTSSILSEPISENYPHSEPETDSKGYEIIKDEALLKQGLPTDSSGYQTQMKIIHSNTKRSEDDGNEADNEEEREKINKFRTSEEDLSMTGSDSISALPHIDSIHSSSYDLNTEILSQHSGRTLENCEAMSTHSSRTLGDGSSTMLAEMGERSKHGTPKSTESPSNTLQRGKVVDEERIQHWVDETSSRLESLALEEESYEDSTDEMTNSDDESDESDEDKEHFDLANNELKKENLALMQNCTTENRIKNDTNLDCQDLDKETTKEIDTKNSQIDGKGSSTQDFKNSNKLQMDGAKNSNITEKYQVENIEQNLDISIRRTEKVNCVTDSTENVNRVTDSTKNFNFVTDSTETADPFIDTVINPINIRSTCKDMAKCDSDKTLDCDRDKDTSIESITTSPENVEIHIE